MPTSRHEAFRIQVLQLTDAIIVLLAFGLGWVLRDVVRDFLGMAVSDISVKDTINWVIYIAVPFTPLILEKFGFYDHIRSKVTSRAIAQLIQSLIAVALIIGVFGLAAKLLDTPRLALGLGFLFVFLLLLARDRLTHVYLRRQKTQESAKEQILLAGTQEETDALLKELDEEVTEGWHVIGHFDLEKRPVSDLFELLKTESVARVIFSAKETGFDKVARAVEACELQGVEAWIAASFIRTQIARPVFDVLGNKPMLVLRTTPELSWELMCKGVFDRVGAAILILISSPIWLISIIGIRLTSPGAPAFFSQMRAGRYGKPFKMWKLRTMVANAEELLEKIKEEHGNQMDGPVFKLEKDPRIFPFGAFLRKTSIDEFPQLLNVLKGDMSLVGPRPLPLYEVEAISDIAHRRRLSVKPGITCEWQAGGRNKITSFEDWVEMDLRYIDNWSLWLDFTILLRTIPAVLFAKGAK